MIKFVGGPRVFLTVNPVSSSYIERYRSASRSINLDRRWTCLNEISPWLVLSVLFHEDEMFYHHSGVDLIDLLRRACRCFLRRERISAVSSIPQQLARNLYLSKERKVFRKLREIWLAIQLDRILGKERVLELYLNVIEFGPDLWGCGEASWELFGAKVGDITPWQATYMTSILPNPRRLVGLDDPDSSRSRTQRMLLFHLYLAGLLDEATCASSIRRVNTAASKCSSISSEINEARFPDILRFRNLKGEGASSRDYQVCLMKLWRRVEILRVVIDDVSLAMLLRAI